MVLDQRGEEMLPLRIAVRLELVDELCPPIQVEGDELFQLIEPLFPHEIRPFLDVGDGSAAPMQHCLSTGFELIQPRLQLVLEQVWKYLIDRLSVVEPHRFLRGFLLLLVNVALEVSHDLVWVDASNRCPSKKAVPRRVVP